MKACKWIPLTAAIFALAGCADTLVMHKKAEEPIDGERARLRIVTNGFVRAIPNRGCLDWSAPGAGMVIGGNIISHGYRRRSLNMPVSTSPGSDMGKDTMKGEMYVAANAPITFSFDAQGPVVGPQYMCVMVRSFIPESGKDYEARLNYIYGQSCSMSVRELGAVEKLVPTTPVGQCR